jgi:hypothetical protein
VHFTTNALLINSALRSETLACAAMTVLTHARRSHNALPPARLGAELHRYCPGDQTLWRYVPQGHRPRGENSRGSDAAWLDNAASGAGGIMAVAA